MEEIEGRERERLIYLKELVYAIVELANLRCTEQVSRLDIPVSRCCRLEAEGSLKAEFLPLFHGPQSFPLRPSLIGWLLHYGG